MKPTDLEPIYPMDVAVMKAQQELDAKPHPMPRNGFPSTCGRDVCAHLFCLRVRRQVSLPCERCGQLIREGESVRVLETNRDDFVMSQEHESCGNVL